MSLTFAPGLPERLRAMIQDLGIAPKRVARELFAELEGLDENPEKGRENVSEGRLGGGWLYQFRIDCSPIVLRFTVAYDVIDGSSPESHETRILTVVPGSLDEE